MIKHPTYIKSADGQIGSYAHLTFGDRPVYRFGTGGNIRFRQATKEELESGSNRLSDLVEQERTAMEWKQLSSREWEAVGRYGKFRIERKSVYGFIRYFACYASEDFTQNFRPKEKLSEAKDFCERSPYWEDAA